MKPTRVLIVDDDDDIRTVLHLTLEHAGFEVLLAEDGIQAVEMARTQTPDAVLLDVMMPRMDGFEALRAIRADARTGPIPVLLLTARTQTHDAVEGLDLGADDYITKPFDSDEVVARVQAAVRRAAQQRSSNPLTGLPGNERITLELSSRVERDEPTALLYVDLDDFKPYNDHYGFLRGDRVLQALGRLLLDVAARSGPSRTFVGHVGGDDFVLISDPAEAEEFAALVCERFDAMVPGLYDPDDVEAGSIEVPDRRGVPQSYGLLSVSIGIATNERRDFGHRGELVTVATEMKRFAKSRRRNGSRYAIDRRDNGQAVELEVELP